MLWATCLRSSAILVSAVFLFGCTEFGDMGPLKPLKIEDVLPSPRDGPAKTKDIRSRYRGPVTAETGPAPTLKTEIIEGTGQFLKEADQFPRVVVHNDNLLINFENADLRDVVRTILGDSLGLNYVYDPRVNGEVTVETSEAISSNAALELMETLLRMNGAALVDMGDHYEIVPSLEAVPGKIVPQLGLPLTPIPPGYAVRVVPLKFISAVQMEKILEPFLPSETVARTDKDRNLIILAGTSREVQVLLRTIETFDLDWLEGMSVGVYPLVHVGVDTMAEELDNIFRSDADGPLAGLIQLVPIKRLNALLVITPRSAYLERVKEWIERLDRTSATGKTLYVYHLDYSKAAEASLLLNEVFGTNKSGREESGGRVAPGLEAVEIKSSGKTSETASAEVTKPASEALPADQSRLGGKPTISENIDVNIIPDEVNNSLLILASPQDYRLIEAALTRIDIPPLQVLIEATIVQVSLTDELRFGVQWFLRNGDTSAVLSRGRSISGDAAFPGFAFILDTINVKAVVDALEAVTTVRVISSPQVVVLDNKTAEFQVGDEVAIATQVRQSTTTDDAPLVSTVEFRDTGVILNVTPRVTAGGAVSMEIDQEFSTVTEGATELTPTISQRRIASSISVNSGETVVLGGLISENTTKTRSGVPVLSRIPVLGALFGSRETDTTRTELMILISPRVIRDETEARAATTEVREKLRALKAFERKDLEWFVLQKRY